MDAPSIAAAEASLEQASTCTPSSARYSCDCTSTSRRCDAGLQQRLGDGKNALAMKQGALSKAQHLRFLAERNFQGDSWAGRLQSMRSSRDRHHGTRTPTVSTLASILLRITSMVRSCG